MGARPDYSHLAEHPILTMPQPAGTIALVTVVAMVSVLLIWSVVQYRASSGTYLLILIAALTGSQIEAWAEFMAMQYHPEIGSYLGYRAWGMPIPVHIVLCYALYFGGPGYGMLQMAQRGVDAKAWAWLLGALGIGVTVADLLAVHSGIWTYYGRQPFVLSGFPIAWLFCNVAAIFGFVVTAHRCLVGLQGMARLLTIVIAPVGLAMTWGGVALPIGNALHSDAGPVVMMAAALASMAVSSAIIWLSIDYLRSVAGVPLAPSDSVLRLPHGDLV